MSKEVLDVVTAKGAFGSVAQKLLSGGMKVNHLRTNATLRKDEWIQYDTAVIKAAQQRLVGIADLMRLGLTYNIGNGLAKTVLEYEAESDITDAEMSMDGITKSSKDRPVYDIKSLPLPILHKDFSLSARVLASSRVTGQSLDVSGAELSARKVSDKAEDILFNGSSSYTFGGGTIYGYTDVPTRNIIDMVKHWDDSSCTGENILEDVREMKQALISDRHYGPYILYVPTGYETKLDMDFKANSDKTIRQRILEISGIMEVKVSDKLAAHNVVLVQMTSDVVRLVEGMPITTVEWKTEGELMFNFKVMAIWVPQIRCDYNSRSGIAHLYDTGGPS